MAESSVRAASVTIQDIARLAGVSRSTVSRVLTHHPHVSDRARRAVERVLRETGYRPSAIARSLATGSSTVIAMVVPSISDPFYAELIAGVEEELAHNYSLVVVSTNDDLRREHEVFARLHEARVGGIIRATAQFGEAPPERQGLPIVLVNRAPADTTLNAVVSDNFRGGYLATSLLLKWGHRRIGHLALNLALPTSRARHEGYLQALAEAHISPTLEWTWQCGLSVAEAMTCGQQLIEEGCPVTALFTDSDSQAIGLIEALSLAGLVVPRDFSIVGYDDNPYGALKPFRLSTVRTPRRLMGELAAQLLKEILSAGRPLPPRRIVLPVELVERASVSVPRAEIPLATRLRSFPRHVATTGVT